MKKITFENTIDAIEKIHPLLSFPVVILWSLSGCIGILKYSFLKK